jgi:hypothetical protein
MIWQFSPLFAGRKERTRCFIEGNAKNSTVEWGLSRHRLFAMQIILFCMASFGKHPAKAADVLIA